MGCHLDKKAFAEIETRLLEVNKVVEKLDESIRVAAFEFLKPYITGANIVAQEQGAGGGEDDAPVGDLAAFVQKNSNETDPSENAKMLSAWWFSQYGSAPFSVKWIKSTGTSTGVTIPAHPAMTFRQAKANGKSLYEPLGKGGLMKPTIMGEIHLKATYKVKKGTKPSPTVSK